MFLLRASRSNGAPSDGGAALDDRPHVGRGAGVTVSTSGTHRSLRSWHVSQCCAAHARDRRAGVGERKEAIFPPDADLLIHRLGGLDLSRVTRVGLTVKVEETGEPSSRPTTCPSIAKRATCSLPAKDISALFPRISYSRSAATTRRTARRSPSTRFHTSLGEPFGIELVMCSQLPTSTVRGFEKS
jgi:hypothetical protein